MGTDLYSGLKIKGFRADYRRSGRGYPTTVRTQLRRGDMRLRGATLGILNASNEGNLI
jgi:hypothetical protein